MDAGRHFREVDREERFGCERLSDRVVWRIVKVATARVGIEPETVIGHSLRSGLAASAGAAEAPD